MKLTRRAILASAAGGALVSGCATASLAPAGPYKAGAAFTVNLGRPWSDMSVTMMPRPPNVQLLSMDGLALNRFYLAALDPGQSLVRPLDKDTPRPTYRSDMSDSELVEFVIDSVAALDYQAPEASALRPQDFGAASGVRFDLSSRTAAGLNISGTALVARAGDKLNLLLFLAPSEHYYGALASEVEAIFASARAA